MLMNDLLQMRIFGLLSETSQEVSNEEMQNAYGEFVEQIRIVGMEVIIPTVYRILVATRIEIASLETVPLYGQGKMRLKSYSYKRHWQLLATELELLNFKLHILNRLPLATPI